MDKLTSAAAKSGTQLAPFLVLVGAVVGLGLLFFQVVRPMILPIFLAAVLAMLMFPLHQRLSARLRNRPRTSAAALTTAVLFMIVGPLATGLYFAIIELYQFVKHVQPTLTEGHLQDLFTVKGNPQLAAGLEWMNQYVSIELEQLQQWGATIGLTIGRVLYDKTIAMLKDVPQTVLAFFMFLFALYFFLADGERILKGWEDLTPLDNEHDRVIRTEFYRVCRGVVWGTVVAAVAQGLVFGVGLAVIELIFRPGVGGWIFLLSLATAMLAVIPFLGAASVWVPTALYFFYQREFAAGIVMVVYGSAVVSTVDNLIKIYVIGDSTDLHPLLVFVCVFGGLQMVGILGIFIGPVVGAVLFASLRIFKRELLGFSGPKVAAAQ